MHGVSSTGSHGHTGYPAEYVRTIRDVTYSGAWALAFLSAPPPPPPANSVRLRARSSVGLRNTHVYRQLGAYTQTSNSLGRYSW